MYVVRWKKIIFVCWKLTAHIEENYLIENRYVFILWAALGCHVKIDYGFFLGKLEFFDTGTKIFFQKKTFDFENW